MSTGIATLSPLQDHLALVPQYLLGGLQPDSILIFLAMPGMPPVPIRVLDSESVASVKLRIQRFKGFVITKQRLLFGGHELSHNNSRVRDYGLADGNVLHLVVRLAELHEIIIETAHGKKFRFQVESAHKVGYLKNMIAAETGEHIESLKDQKLVLGNKELEDHQLITDIAKKGDAVIHLFINQAAKVQTKQTDKQTVVQVVTPKENGNRQIDAMNRIDTDSCTYSCRHPTVEPILVNRKVKLSPAIMEMIDTTIAGLEDGYLPVMSAEGSGGVYFMKDSSGESNVAVFKPIDEEPMAENNPRGLPLSVDGEGLKRGTLVGEGALREVAAYLLDHPIDGCKSDGAAGFSGVPPTALVRSFHMGKEIKIGSLQMFVQNRGSCEGMGSQAFPVKEVQKITVLDIRLANADRHAGNILVCQDRDRLQLVPIDHGYCFPEKFEDCTFEWLYWPQAREPFSIETLAYIKSLDAVEDIALLKFHGWELSPQCARVLHVSTMLLKKGAERGLTAYNIGSIMCREVVTRKSEIEALMEEAEDYVLPETSEETFLETVSEIMDGYLDKVLPVVMASRPSDDLLFDMYKNQVLKHLRSKMNPDMLRTLERLKDGHANTSDLGVCKLRLESFLASMVAREDVHTSEVSDLFLCGLNSCLESIFGSVLSKEVISGIVGVFALHGSKTPSMQEENEKLVIDVLKFLVESKMNGSEFLTPPLKHKDVVIVNSPAAPAKRPVKKGNPIQEPYNVDAKVLFAEVQDIYVIDGPSKTNKEPIEKTHDEGGEPK